MEYGASILHNMLSSCEYQWDILADLWRCQGQGESMGVNGSILAPKSLGHVFSMELVMGKSQENHGKITGNLVNSNDSLT